MARIRGSTLYGLLAVGAFVVGFAWVVVRDVKLIRGSFPLMGAHAAWPPLAVGVLSAGATAIAWAILLRRWSGMSIPRRRIAAVVALVWLSSCAIGFLGAHGLYGRTFTIWRGIQRVDTRWEMVLLAYQAQVIAMGVVAASTLCWLWVRDILRNGY